MIFSLKSSWKLIINKIEKEGLSEHEKKSEKKARLKFLYGDDYGDDNLSEYLRNSLLF